MGNHYFNRRLHIGTSAIIMILEYQHSINGGQIMTQYAQVNIPKHIPSSKVEQRYGEWWVCVRSLEPLEIAMLDNVVADRGEELVVGTEPDGTQWLKVIRRA